MAYNNYYPAGYQPMYSQNNYMPQQNNQMPQQNVSRKYVSSEEAVRTYPVAPNQTVDLWATDANVIYEKSADQTGRPFIRIIDYSYRDNVPQTPKFADMGAFASKDDVDSLKHEIEALKAKFASVETVEKKEKAK